MVDHVLVQNLAQDGEGGFGIFQKVLLEGNEMFGPMTKHPLQIFLTQKHGTQFLVFLVEDAEHALELGMNDRGFVLMRIVQRRNEPRTLQVRGIHQGEDASKDGGVGGGEWNVRRKRTDVATETFPPFSGPCTHS